MRIVRLFACVLCVGVGTLSGFISSGASADDSCAWSTQTNGNTWGTCVDSNGRQYCVSCPSGIAPSSSCPRVPCNGGN